MLLGIMTGLLKLPFISILEPLGNAYLSLLQMSVIPIMASALTVSVYKLLKSKGALTYLKRTLLTFVIMLTAVTVLGLSVSFMFKGVVFNDAKAKDALGDLMLSGNQGTVQTNFTEIDSRRREVSEQKQSLTNMLIGMIPQNIFSALAKGENLKLVFFFMLISIVAAFLPEARVLPLIKAFEGIYDIFIKFIDILMYLLPLGIFSLTAVQLSKTGIAVMLSLSKLVLVIYF
jgi:proton glutamate symport protein